MATHFSALRTLAICLLSAGVGMAATACGDSKGSVLGDGGANADGSGGAGDNGGSGESAVDQPCPASSDELCNGVCTDTSSSPSHCGACGNDCGELVCSAGECADSCRGDQTECAGACVDVDSDVRHCGTCGNSCELGQSCESGSCVGDPIGSGGSGNTGGSDGSGGGGSGLIGDGELPKGEWTPKEEQVSEITTPFYDLTVHQGKAFVAAPLESGDAQVFEYDGGWKTWGDPLAPADGNVVLSVKLRFDDSGDAVVATMQRPLGKPHELVFVHHYVDDKWQGYGGKAKRTGAVFSQSFDLEVDGDDVYVLYTSHPGDTSTHDPTVQHWDGKDWSTLPAPDTPSALQRSFSSDLAIDSAGKLFLAWTENVGEPATPDGVLILSRWTGSAWSQTGDTLFDLFDPQVSFTSDGTLVLAGTRGGKAEALALTNSWMSLGEPLSLPDGGDARSPQLALTPGDTPVLAFRDTANKVPKVLVYGLQESWTSLGQPIGGGEGFQDVKQPRIASDGTSLWLTWTEAKSFSDAGGFLRAARLE